MTAHARLLVAIAEVPDPPTLSKWRCEALQLGFKTRGVILRLCWQRWFWRCVEHLGPTRDVWGDWEAVE